MIATFIGHRNTPISNRLKKNIKHELRKLLTSHPTTQFLFGSRSRFDDACLEIVSQLKSEFPQLKRIYVRSFFKQNKKLIMYTCLFVFGFYSDYLLTLYDDTIFPDIVANSGKAAYIKRNMYMINNCDILFVYYDPSYTVKSENGIKRNSGTKIAVEYALTKNKKIINFFYK